MVAVEARGREAAAGGAAIAAAVPACAGRGLDEALDHGRAVRLAVHRLCGAAREALPLRPQNPSPGPGPGPSQSVLLAARARRGTWSGRGTAAPQPREVLRATPISWSGKLLLRSRRKKKKKRRATSLGRFW